jgi:hypothetical protein
MILEMDHWTCKLGGFLSVVLEDEEFPSADSIVDNFMSTLL